MHDSGQLTTKTNLVTPNEVTVPDTDPLTTESKATEAPPDLDLTTEVNVVTPDVDVCVERMCKNAGTLMMYGRSCTCACRSRWTGADCSG